MSTPGSGDDSGAGAAPVPPDERPVDDDRLADVVIRPAPTDEPSSADEEKSDVTTKGIPEKQEDARKLISLALLVGLGLVSVGWTLVGILGDKGDIATAGAALDKIFTGILGLTGTAVGFYFGRVDHGGGTAGHGGSSKSNGGGR